MHHVIAILIIFKTKKYKSTTEDIQSVKFYITFNDNKVDQARGRKTCDQST